MVNALAGAADVRQVRAPYIYYDMRGADLSHSLRRRLYQVARLMPTASHGACLAIALRS